MDNIYNSLFSSYEKCENGITGILNNNRHFTRVHFSNAYTNEIISFSWLNMKLSSFEGPDIKDNTSFKDRQKKIYFKCDNYGLIYILRDHIDYIYNSAIKHCDLKTASIIKRAINCIDKGYREYEKKQLQVRSS